MMYGSEWGMMDRSDIVRDINMIALDLDGTVLTSGKRVTDRTLDAIIRTIEKGIEVVYTTGRPLSGLPVELMDIPGVRYAVTSNGAVTYDLKNEQKLRTSLLDTQAARQIIELPEISGLIYSVFIDGMGYCDMDTYQTLVRIHRGGLYEEYVRRSRTGVEDISEFIGQSPDGIENIWITTREKELRDAINEIIKSRYQARTVLTGNTDVEAGNLCCDKGLALKDLADRLHMDMKHIMAIGDNDNDLGMFAHAGLSVAMGNAPDFVKKKALAVTDTNDNDGVAKVLDLL